MTLNPFDGLTPTHELWVSTTGSAHGDGSGASPFATIQQAIAHAKPGTAVMVEAGTYVGNTQISSQHSGAANAPIWIVSADGPGQAHLVGAASGKPVIGGGGVSNIVVEGFHITGGQNGVQFSQDGYAFTKTIDNIVVQDNTIDGALQDGVKANGGEHVYVVGNTITNGEGQQGVDFVSVDNGVIADNEISRTTGSAAIFVKGGSTSDVIEHNYVHDLAGDGIGVGYHMGDMPFAPGHTGYEASNILVTGNEVVNVGGRAVVAVGATDSTVTGNWLGTNGAHYDIAVNNDQLTTQGVAHTYFSSDLSFTGNIFANAAHEITITQGNSTGLVVGGNIVGAAFTAPVGPSAEDTAHFAAFLATADHLF